MKQEKRQSVTVKNLIDKLKNKNTEIPAANIVQMNS